MEERHEFPRTLPEFDQRFGTEEACWEYLFKVRWPKGWRCRLCSRAHGWRNRRRAIQCAVCGHQSSVTAGTVFHATKKPLRLWFKAIFLMVTQKNGVSAKTIERLLGVSYPTAWTWLQKLRRVIGQRPRRALCGVVQVDDAYFGGYKKGEQGRHKGGGSKDLVVVEVEEKDRGMGRARMVWVPDHRGESFVNAVEGNVAVGSVVRTDGLGSYNELEAKGDRHRPAVIGKEKVRALELFAHVHRVVGLAKRWLLGTHQGAVRGKHFGAYLEEFTFRFNRRTSQHRTLLFERLVGWGMQHRADPYWRIIRRPRPDIPLHIGGT